MSENNIFLFHPNSGSSIFIFFLIAMSHALKKKNNLLHKPPFKLNE